MGFSIDSDKDEVGHITYQFYYIEGNKTQSYNRNLVSFIDSHLCTIPKYPNHYLADTHFDSKSTSSMKTKDPIFKYIYKSGTSYSKVRLERLYKTYKILIAKHNRKDEDLEMILSKV